MLNIDRYKVVVIAVGHACVVCNIARVVKLLLSGTKAGMPSRHRCLTECVHENKAVVVVIPVQLFSQRSVHSVCDFVIL